MANIPLQSITFPGLSDKYTTPVVDNTLTQTGAAADAKKTGDEIGAIKNDLSEFPNGNYPQMGAGYANQLVSGLKKEDSTPYNFRRIPYDATLEDVKKIVGGTIVNNQLVGTTDTSITVQSGHKAYKSISGTTSVFTSDGTAITVTGGTDIVIDLTQMLGTSIADYVLSLETATAGAGVTWLKEHFPKQFDAGYQAYDAGTLKSIEGLSAKKTVGFNQWDEVAEVGSIGNNGEDVVYNNVRTKGYNPAFPSTTYYVHCPNAVVIFWYDANKTFISSVNSVRDMTITSPSNASYFRFRTSDGYGTTYNHDICINLSDPTKNGTYEPYEAHSYALDSDVVLRGIPKLDSNNQLYYDGDEYLPDGTVNRRFGIVDMGSISWIYDTNSVPHFIAQANQFPQKPKFYGGLVCVKFIGTTKTYNTLADLEMCVDNSEQVPVFRVRDDAYTSAADFKTAMSGVYLVYELKTPTTETADPYTTPQIVSPDGTEEYIYEDGAFELPVGHSSDYPVDVSGQLDDILDTPSANGTYTLKATVTDGAVAYSWVADA